MIQGKGFIIDEKKPELASKISVNNQLNFLIEMFDDSHLILTRDGMITFKNYQLSVIS
ncbi:MAG TPA: hypothetical protein V6C58_06170 [Allocoleopsis sp.]